jgi:hypothetical protein
MCDVSNCKLYQFHIEIENEQNEIEKKIGEKGERERKKRV